MPLNEQDRSWIRETIQSAHKPHGLGRLTRFLKEWSGAGAAVAFILFALTQWTGYIEFRTSTSDRLKSIEGLLAKENLTVQDNLPLSDFATVLPQIGSDLSKINKQRLKLAPSVVENIQKKLISTDNNAQGYWPAAAELITYKSPSGDTELPDCAQSTPKQLSWLPLEPGKDGTPPPHQFTLSNCHLNLDVSMPASPFATMGPPDSFTIVCDHCVVTYSGGQIPPWGLKGYINLIFNHCDFVFSTPNEPPIKGKSLVKAVLASLDSESVSYNLSAS